ncbi:MAG: hypothetical protein HYY24_03810 [Verrucomicrobia bacterium]|nr:hypothetical protein [Verrucomicrobiota bacterium]
MWTARYRRRDWLALTLKAAGVAGSFACLAFLAPPAMGQQNIELIISQPSPGVERQLTTFEGAAEGSGIGTIPGSIMSFPGWAATTGVAGTPSGVTTALVFNADSLDVLFSSPVLAIGCAYASVVPVTVEAYDAGNVLLSSASFPSNDFGWSTLSLAVSGNAITRLRFHAADLQTVIDDFYCDRSVGSSSRLVTIDVKPGNGNDIDPINLKAQGSLPLAVFSTPDFDATTLDVATLQLGDPNLVQIATVVWGNPEDVDGDGRLDAMLHFSASELVDGGALNADTTELLLTGRTTSGQEIFGTDQVRIVGGGN